MSQFYGRIGNTIPEGIDRLKMAMRRRLRKMAEAAGAIVAERAYDLANVSPGDTGHANDGTHMRDNIAVEVIETGTTIEARVGIDMSNVPYAHHQEFGSRGKPFLRPAMDESRPEIHEMMQDAMEDEDFDAKSFVRFVRGSRPSEE